MQLAGCIVGHIPAATGGRLDGRLGPPPLVAPRIVDQRSLVAGFTSEDDDHLLVAIPRCAPIGCQTRRWQGTHVLPAILGQIVRPDGGVVQVDFPPPLPAVAAAELGKADVAADRRSVDVLRVAADARRRRVGFLERPLGGLRVEGPDLGPLLAATALVVPAVTDDQLVLTVPDTGAFVAQPWRNWPVG